MSEKATFNTMTAKALMDTSIPPTRYIIDGFLSQGLHVLAGAPKAGKSYLTLWLCACIATGKPVWGMETRKCGVLYIALEDTPERLKKRLAEVTDEFPENIEFVTHADTLSDGFTEQLDGYLSEHRDVKFVAVDTLQKIRSGGSEGNGTQYADDYNSLGKIKEIADKHKAAVLLIHHLRKASSNDPFQMISGSTGITGAVDTSYVLRVFPNNRTIATLYVTGRDVEYQTLSLFFCKGMWHLIDRNTQSNIDEDKEPSALVAKVIEIVCQNRGWKGTPTQLLFLTGESIPVNMLTLRIKTQIDILERFGITMSMTRTGKNRFVCFELDEEKAAEAAEAIYEQQEGLLRARKEGYHVSDDELMTAFREQQDDGCDSCDGSDTIPPEGDGTAPA